MIVRSSGRRPARSPHGSRLRSRCVTVMVGVAVMVVLAATTPPVAWAQTGPQQLEQVIANLRNFLVGLLVGLSTLFLTLGGVRYLAADGDPGEVERAKRSLRNALLGYALAALAPVAVSILRSLVG